MKRQNVRTMTEIQKFPRERASGGEEGRQKSAPKDEGSFTAKIVKKKPVCKKNKNWKRV